MILIKRFGSGSKLYTFPSNSQVSYSDNFASLVTKTVRLAGVNGGFSNLGTGRGLSPIGTVRADFWLKDFKGSDATTLKNQLRQMADYGVQQLFRQPDAGAEEFCWARITDIGEQLNVANVPHQRQKFPVVWEVPDPFWYRPASGYSQVWDGTALWDDGSKWDVDTGYAVANSLTQSFTNNGNTYTLPRIFLSNTSGSSVSDIRVQRIVNGYTEDEFYYTTPLATGTYLDIEPARLRAAVLPTGTNALPYFTYKSPDWMRLLPGTNSITVTCMGSLTLYVQFLERII